MLPINAAKKWTEDSVYCYERGCNCQGCYMKDLIESIPCQMKKSVMELVRKFGKPQEEKQLSSTQQRVINAILAGCNNKVEIVEYTDLNETNVQSALSKMYEIAEFDGVIYSHKRNKLGDFINWVRKEKDED